ncbi:MAG: hypothetical protein AAF230_08655 [Pseudomonadota bacterium]
MAQAILTFESALVSGILSGIQSFWRSFSIALTVNATTEARLQELNRLRALTESELAELGLNRDTLVHHVFGDILTS